MSHSISKWSLGTKLRSRRHKTFKSPLRTSLIANTEDEPSKVKKIIDNCRTKKTRTGSNYFNPVLLNQQAYAYLNIGETGKAIECFEKSSKIDPNDLITYQILGTLYAETGRPKNAIITYIKGLIEYPYHHFLLPKLTDILNKERINFEDVASEIASKRPDLVLDKNQQMAIQFIQDMGNDDYVIKTQGSLKNTVETGVPRNKDGAFPEKPKDPLSSKNLRPLCANTPS